MSPAWDPPAVVAVVAGGAAALVWLWAAPPRRSEPARAALRLGAAAVLALALVDAGCRRAEAPGRRLLVLLDTSLSMEVAEPGGATRLDAARAWLQSDEFADWSAGWSVTRDSFGGASTDPGAAVDRAASELPDAILILSDGRAAGGRAVDPPPVPLYVRVPGPAEVADAAVLDLSVEEPADGPARLAVDVAAAGGLDPGERRVVVTVDGAPAGEAPAGALVPGERRTVRVPLSAGGPAERVIEARLEPADAVPGNDVRSLVYAGGAAVPRALLVGVRPGWEMAAWRSALERVHPGPVDTYWSGSPGVLRPAGGGSARGWGSLDPARYRLALVVGEPAADGEAWLERFAAGAGRGLGRFPSGGAGTARPEPTEAGRRWLAAAGVDAPGPAAAAPWPPIEGLPVESEPPAGSVPLFEADGRPVAWVVERPGRRTAVALGTGWYRWRLAGEAPARFWEAWSGALIRWLAAAESSDLPLVRLPAGGRVARGAELRAERLGDPGPLDWRVVDAAGETRVEGTLEAGATGGLRAGPFPPGAYALEAEGPGGRRTRARFVVEPWAPDLAWTAADSASLARAARASGGGVLEPGASLPALVAGGPARAAVPGAARGLGTAPWGYLLAAGLVLADWALAGRRRREG